MCVPVLEWLCLCSASSSSSSTMLFHMAMATEVSATWVSGGKDFWDLGLSHTVSDVLLEQDTGRARQCTRMEPLQRFTDLLFALLQFLFCLMFWFLEVGIFLGPVWQLRAEHSSMRWYAWNIKSTRILVFPDTILGMCCKFVRITG